MTPNRKTQRGLTVWELLVCLVALFLLFALFAPTVNHEKERSPRSQCLNNQKQVALGFLLWANDVGEAFPMQLPPERGGTQGPKFQHAIAAQFFIISNELNRPQILACPADKKRKPATTFSQVKQRNISYFLNLGLTTNRLDQVVVGDRNLILSSTEVRGYVQATNGVSFSWAKWLHSGEGNLALVDGSAHMANNRILQETLSRSEPSAIRLLVP